MRSLPAFFSVFAAVTTAAFAQPAPTLTCQPSAVPALVHQEGITERMGDIVFNCTAGPVSGTVTGNLAVFLSTGVTNRLSGTNVLGPAVRLETRAGSTVLSSTSMSQGPNGVAFSPISIPVTAGGTVSLRVTGLLGNASAVTTMGGGQPLITAGVSVNGISLTSTSPQQFTVAYLTPSLAATIANNSVRFTEKFADSFDGRLTAVGAGLDTGTRLIVRFSGVPTGVVVTIPDALAGSSAVEPTSGGTFGLPKSGGRYTPGTPGGTLLLSRVNGADANGVGGVPMLTPTGTETITLEGASEVGLTEGAGYAVYEVIDENPQVRESAQFKFDYVWESGCCRDAVVDISIRMGPISNVLQADPSATLPRFVEVEPDLDCDDLGDCSADYFPLLSVAPLTLSLTAASGGNPTSTFLKVTNAGGGELISNFTLSYTDGSGWLVYDPGQYKLSALGRDLAPGTYRGALTIDAGPIAGSKTVAVTLTVTPPVPPKGDRPVISKVVNGANFSPNSLPPGSIATIFGERFTGNVTVAFDEFAANVLFVNQGQINVIVPSGVSNRNSTKVVVTADGGASVPYTVSLTWVYPAVFGALNQNNTLNTKDQPAPTGSVLQVFLTGGETSGYGGTGVRIHDRFDPRPLYSGPAPGIPGMQQVNVVIPEDLPAMQSELLICVTDAIPLQVTTVCSRPLTIWLSKP